MKATELMCGDLILVDGRPTRVYGVMERMNRVYDTMTNDISLKRCEPIPITPEILEKNGFKPEKNESGESFQWVIAEDYYDIIIYEWSDSIWLFMYESTEMNIPANQATISYIHELQQMLRLCGISKEILP